MEFETRFRYWKIFNISIHTELIEHLQLKKIAIDYYSFSFWLLINLEFYIFRNPAKIQARNTKSLLNPTKCLYLFLLKVIIANSFLPFIFQVSQELGRTTAFKDSNNPSLRWLTGCRISCHQCLQPRPSESRRILTKVFQFWDPYSTTQVRVEATRTSPGNPTTSTSTLNTVPITLVYRLRKMLPSTPKWASTRIPMLSRLTGSTTKTNTLNLCITHPETLTKSPPEDSIKVNPTPVLGATVVTVITLPGRLEPPELVEVHREQITEKINTETPIIPRIILSLKV